MFIYEKPTVSPHCNFEAQYTFLRIDITLRKNQETNYGWKQNCK